MNEPTMQPNKTVSPRHGFSVHQIAAIGIMSAVTCILAPFSIPIGPVPISLTNLAIYFALYILGMKEGTISYLIYLLIGLIGIPVFSGFTSGPEKLFGPTGGYLIGFIPMAVIAGIIIDRFTSKRFLCLAGMDWKAALWAGVIPFIPGDLIKMLLAIMIGPKIQAQLIRANLR